MRRITSGMTMALRFYLLAALLSVPLSSMQAQTPTFTTGAAVGMIRTSDIWEASGIVASRQNAGVLWTHNDSGFPGTMFALSKSGDLLGTCTVANGGSG